MQHQCDFPKHVIRCLIPRREMKTRRRPEIGSWFCLLHQLHLWAICMAHADSCQGVCCSKDLGPDQVLIRGKLGSVFGKAVTLSVPGEEEICV